MPVLIGDEWRHIAHRMECAQSALSPREMRRYCDDLHAIAPNPFDQGKANQESAWALSVEQNARRLVWC